MVLAFTEHVVGAPTMLSLEVLTMARRLARGIGAPLEAVAIGPKAAAAAPNISEKITICRISLRAMASTMLTGNVWATKSLSVRPAVVRSL